MAISRTTRIAGAPPPSGDAVVRTLPFGGDDAAAASAGVPGAWIATPPDSATPIRFSDGTRLVIQPQSRVRVASVDSSGGRLVLENGVVRAAVIHRPGARWLVDSGPFEVLVTGTRFDVHWNPAAEELVVKLDEGSVVVSGPVIGDRFAVKAGQTLRVRRRIAPDRSWPSPPSGGAFPAMSKQQTVRIVPSSAGVEVWIVDRMTGKTVLREIVTKEGGSASGDATVALRVVELLRASLMELDAARPPEGEMQPPPLIRELMAPPRRAPPAAPPIATLPAPDPPAFSICLVNHVQGRAGCPLGQAAPTPCTGPDDTSCESGSSCVAAGTTGPFCSLITIDGGPPQPDGSSCESGICNEQRNTCMCTSDAQCPSGTICDPVAKECTRYVCHAAGACQSAEATNAENEGKSCCTPGADVPVTGAVCGQCEKGSGRNAEEDIYCSCRYGPADGAAPDGSTYCACPGGFECSQIRPNVGLGDPELTGEYCIRTGTAYSDPGQCGGVSGHLASSCDGTPAN